MSVTRRETLSTNGIRLHAAMWRPPGEPGAVVLLAHGYAEHIGRYTHVAEVLIEHGHAVVGLDHRGHGQSDGRRAAIRRFDDYVDDLHRLAGDVGGIDPRHPRFLLGHSMGGLIAIRYALTHQHELAGLIVTGPALIVDEGVSPLVRGAGRLVARLVPDFPLVPRKRDVLSTDPEVERCFDADPLCYTGRARVALADQLVRASADALARAHELTLPLLIMHGADDRLTSPNGSRLLHERARSPDKTLIFWPGLRHELFNEPRRDAVLARVVTWLDERVSGAPADVAHLRSAGRGDR